VGKSDTEEQTEENMRTVRQLPNDNVFNGETYCVHFSEPISRMSTM